MDPEQKYIDPQGCEYPVGLCCVRLFEATRMIGLHSIERMWNAEKVIDVLVRLFIRDFQDCFVVNEAVPSNSFINITEKWSFFLCVLMNLVFSL